MAKKRISSTDLAWVFLEQMRSFDDCAGATAIAILPSRDGWTVVTNRTKSQRPSCARRIEQIQKRLRRSYVLARD
jgi:hypothetical protein